MSCLYLSCSAIMDSPGGEFNSFKSKHLLRHGRCEVVQTRKNMAIAEDFRIAYLYRIQDNNVCTYSRRQKKVSVQYRTFTVLDCTFTIF